MNRQYFSYLFIVVTVVLVNLLVPKVLFACDTCQGRNPGDTWTNAGRSYRCDSCNAVSCWYSSTYGSGSHCSVASHPFYGAICDESCPYGVSGKYTVDLGAAGPSCTSVTAPQVNFNQDAGNFTVQANGVSNASSVWFHIWSPLNNKDDERILPATDVGGGVWRVTDQLELHSTHQPDTRIFVDAYMNASAYAGGSYCGSVVGSLHKATPPTGRIYNPTDPTGGDIRDAFITIRDDINSAEAPIQLTVTGTDPHPGTVYNGLTNVWAFRRACNSTNGNCADYTGGWVGWGVPPCPANSASCSVSTNQWSPIMGDLISGSRWQAVVNVYDRSGYQCSGNAYTAWTSPFQEPWTRCDRNSTSYDRYNIYLNVLPRGWIDTNAVRVNGVAQTTRTITAQVGDVIQLNANGTDSNLDDTYAPNYAAFVTATRYSLATGFVDFGTASCAAGSPSCTLNNATWNTAASAPGTYQVLVKVSDNVGVCNGDGQGRSWAASSLLSYQRCDRNAGSNFATANDVITVTLNPPSRTVSGTTFVTTTACVADTSGATNGNSGNVSVNGTFTGSIAGTSWSVPNITSGTNANQVCATLSPNAGNNYALSCVDLDGISGNGNEHTISAGNCITLSPSQTINTSVNTWRLGFIASPPTSWITIYEGDAFSNGGMNMALPNIVNPSFERFVLVDKDSVGGSGYFHSNASVSPSGSTLYESGGGFYDTSDSAAMNLWPSSYTTSVPVACSANTISNVSTFGNLDSSRCYFAPSAIFNSWAGGSSGTVTYNINNANSVVTVYVGDSSSLNITKNILSSSANERVVFVFLRDAIFAPVVGGDGVTVNMQGGFMAVGSNQVVVETQGSPTPDTTLNVSGFLVSNSRVHFKRNRINTNTIPSTVVQYSTQYLSTMTAAERASSNSNNTGVFVNNISWYYGN